MFSINKEEELIGVLGYNIEYKTVKVCNLTFANIINCEAYAKRPFCKKSFAQDFENVKSIIKSIPGTK